MTWLEAVPTINATLNATSGVLILVGFGAIRRGRVATHASLMLAACATSTAFLLSYVCYHAQVGSVHFRGQGAARAVYFAILGSHTVLAIALVPLIWQTLRLALRHEFKAHRRLARVTFPVWLYVSVTGVIVYWMLYHL